MGNCNKGEELFGQLFGQMYSGSEAEDEWDRLVDTGPRDSMFGPALARVVVWAGVEEEEVLMRTLIISQGLEEDCLQDPMLAVRSLLWLVRMFRRGGGEGMEGDAFREVCVLCGLVPGNPVCPHRLAVIYNCLVEVAAAMWRGETVRY